jgi:hypothetical protein
MDSSASVSYGLQEARKTWKSSVVIDFHRPKDGLSMTAGKIINPHPGF